MSSALSLERESALVASIRDGTTVERTRALDELFRALGPSILAVCARVTGSTSDAEDALQETFSALFRALPGFRQDARIKTWAYRIALREALRVKARRRPIELVAEPTHDPGHEQRVVIALFSAEGLGHAEIADVLGIPEGTVWSRLHLARKKLASLLTC